jgi:cell wall assembly regulator SMI1
MPMLDLADLRAAYTEWIDAPAASFHYQIRHPERESLREFSVHVFAETEDDPFVYLATAGISLNATNEHTAQVELVLTVAGLFDQGELGQLAQGISELVPRWWRQESALAANMILDGIALPRFERMSKAMLSDFNVVSAEYLAEDPPVRLLRLTPLFDSEGETAKDIGDVEVYGQMRAQAVDYRDPARVECQLRPPAAPEPDTSAVDVTAIWDDITTWLGQNAQPTLATLHSGANPQDIDRAEEILGIRLPAAYRQSLLRHDGQTYLTDYEYLSLQQVLRIWNSKRNALERGDFVGREVYQHGNGVIRNFWWHPGWIPFAEDSGGNLLCLDLAPASKGHWGQVLCWERTTGPYPGTETSFAEWLRTYRDDLLDGCRVEVDEDGLLRPI